MQKKVCDREKKTDVFCGGRLEKKPRVNPPQHTRTFSPSLHVGSFCMRDYLGDNLVSLSLSLSGCLSPSFCLTLLLYVCAETIVIQAWVELLDCLTKQNNQMDYQQYYQRFKCKLELNIWNSTYQSKISLYTNVPILFGTISQNRWFTCFSDTWVYLQVMGVTLIHTWWRARELHQQVITDRLHDSYQDVLTHPKLENNPQTESTGSPVQRQIPG